MISLPKEARPPNVPSAPLVLPDGNEHHPGHLHRVVLIPLKSEPLEGLPLIRPPTAVPLVPPLFGARCKTKGCVFPASDQATGMCHFHDLQESEPTFFQSIQPILHVIDQARFGVAGEAVEDDRRRDRRLQASSRKAFLEGGE